LTAEASGLASQKLQARQKWMSYTDQTRFVGGRNFFKNEGKWTDVEIQQHPRARTVRIAFASPEYFDFGSRYPQALSWLALGPNVQFMLDDVRYEIYE
jgi:hypothetical protein